MSFELIRMLCVNSYKHGRITELNLAGGHVLILGRNGAGKTTLAQLIPLFYGVPASNLVDRAGGKTPIAEFLLKGRASYIVFEYRRHDDIKAGEAGESGDNGLRTVVMRSDDVHKMVYQFFRGGYDPRLFITESQTFRDFADLGPTARSLGLRPSEVLGNADYTRVIQNVRSGTRREDAISKLAAEFACVEAGRNLRYLDKIVGSMFKESAGFEDLQRIVISALKLRSEKSTRELQLSRSDIYSWRDHRREYIEVMRQAPQMEIAKREASKLTELTEDLGKVRGQATRLQARADDNLRNGHARRKTEVATHDSDIKDFNTRVFDCQTELNKTTDELRAVNIDLKAIEERRTYFENQNAARSCREVEHDLPEVLERLTAAIKHQKILLGKQSSVAEEIGLLITERRSRTLSEMESLGNQRELARQNATTKKSQVEQNNTLVLNTLRQQFDDKLKPRSSQRDGFTTAIATHQARFMNPTASPETLERIGAIEQVIEDLNLEWSKSVKAVSDALAAQQLASGKFNSAETRVGALNTQVTLSTRTISELEIQIHPRDDTLLAYLRTNLDGWEQTIGKVIEPSLLNRDDLQPCISSQPSKSLLGVDLNLASIQVSAALSVEALKSAKVAAERELDDLQARLLSAEGEWRVAGDELKAAGDAVVLANSKQARDTGELNSEKQRLKGEKINRDQQIAQCKADALEAKQSSERELVIFDRQTRSINDECTKECARQNLLAEADKKRLDDERDAELHRLDDKRLVIERAEADDIKKYEADRLERLNKAGVDPVKLVELDLAVRKEESSVKRIESLRNLVSDWKAWKESVETREPQLLLDAMQLRDLKARQTERSDEVAALKRNAVEKHMKVLERIDEDNERLKNLLSECDQVIATVTARDLPVSLRDYPETPEEKVLVTGASLQVKAGQIVSDIRHAAPNLRTAMNLVRSAMMGTSSVIRDFYNQTNASRSDDPMVWAAELGKWFDYLHRDMLQTLVGTSKNIEGQIREFYDSLVEFNHQVGLFNGKLQKGLERSMMVDSSGKNRFDKLSGLAITVTSSIQDQQMWAPLETFIGQLNAITMRQVPNEVPSEEFVDALTKVLSTWGSDRTLSIDLSNQVRMRGKIIENGKSKTFASAAEFKNVSSSGLSCIVLMAVLCGFVHMVRGESQSVITWAIDETGRLDAPNIRAMLDVLTDNKIRLVTATPDLPKRSMQQFDRIVQVVGDQDVVVTRIPDDAYLTARYKEMLAKKDAREQASTSEGVSANV